MTFDDELILISTTSGQNGIGDTIQNEHRTTILCDELSVTRTEHYSAAAHGLRPEKVFAVNRYEYHGQRLVEFEGERYTVMRTFRPKKAKGIDDFETIELVCTGLVNRGAPNGSS